MLNTGGQPHKPVFFRRLPQGVFVPEQAGFERRVNKGIGIRLKIPKGCLGVAKIKIVDKVGVCRFIGCKQTVLEADLVGGRSEERRVGKEWGSTWKSRW